MTSYKYYKMNYVTLTQNGALNSTTIYMVDEYNNGCNSLTMYNHECIVEQKLLIDIMHMKTKTHVYLNII